MERWTDLSWVNLHDRFMSMTRCTSGLNTASQSLPSLRNSGGTVAGSRSIVAMANERGPKRRSRREEGKRVGKYMRDRGKGESDCLAFALNPPREHLPFGALLCTLFSSSHYVFLRYLRRQYPSPTFLAIPLTLLTHILYSTGAFNLLSRPLRAPPNSPHTPVSPNVLISSDQSSMSFHRTSFTSAISGMNSTPKVRPFSLLPNQSSNFQLIIISLIQSPVKSTNST